MAGKNLAEKVSSEVGDFLFWLKTGRGALYPGRITGEFEGYEWPNEGFPTDKDIDRFAFPIGQSLATISITAGLFLPNSREEFLYYASGKLFIYLFI